MRGGIERKTHGECPCWGLGRELAWRRNKCPCTYGEMCAYERPVVRLTPARNALSSTASRPRCTREDLVSTRPPTTRREVGLRLPNIVLWTR